MGPPDPGGLSTASTGSGPFLGDAKPGNVVIDVSNDAWLIGFGRGAAGQEVGWADEKVAGYRPWRDPRGQFMRLRGTQRLRSAQHVRDCATAEQFLVQTSQKTIRILPLHLRVEDSRNR